MIGIQCHAMGFNGNGDEASLVTNTGVSDSVDSNIDGVSPAVGHYFRFDGPSGHFLVTSFDGGGQSGSAVDFGVPDHFADAGASYTYNGITYLGADDLMTPYYFGNQRRLISQDDLAILHDSFGYTVQTANYYGTEYDTLDASGKLRIQPPAGNNTINLTESNGQIVVNMTLGSPVAGADPSTITSYFNASLVSSIVITGSSGNDPINLTGIDPTIPLTINANGGTYSLNLNVTTTADTGTGSLRQAIADANLYGDPDTIDFRIPTSDPNYSAGVFTISPATQLPTITDPNLTIDGNTQENYTGSTNGGRPVIFLVGSPSVANGLVVSASLVNIENLGVDSFPGTIFGGGGIVLTGAAATYDSIGGCLIGVGPNGSSPAGNGQGVDLTGGTFFDVIGSRATGDNNVIGDNATGVAISNASECFVTGNDIGLTAALGSAPNGTGVYIADTGSNVSNSILYDIIGDNTGNGVLISGSTSQSNSVQGCDIGVTYSSSGIVGYFGAANGGDGILLNDGATSNLIGGTISGAGNVIAGNTGDGIEFDDAIGNTAEANTIGLATHSLFTIHGITITYNPNLGAGVYVHDGAAGNQIGNTTTNNVISDNSKQGLLFASDAGTGNSVVDDYIGNDSSGDSVGNLNEGVLLSSNGETITGNVVSGNAYSGMSIIGNSNSVTGNYIGINPAGTAALPNQHEGIYLGGNSNTISGNVISGNGIAGDGYTGISPTGSHNTVANNYIGLNAAGNAAIPNQGDGIGDTGTSNTFSDDVVSGNAASGIDLQGGGNTVSGCSVGTNAAGNAAIPNQTNGVLVGSASNTNTISGDVVSGNVQSGIALEAGNNTVTGCKIGTDSTGSAAIPNGIGVYISGSGNVIGGTSAATRNVISGNSAQGILFDSDAGTGNSVIDDYIGTNSAGASIGNSNEGMLISSNGETITGNVISGNCYSGMTIGGNSNTVTGNYIGINPAGTAALPNQHEGIYLGGNSNTISGNVISGNGISGDGYTGISPTGSNNTVSNNYIGLNAAGTAAIPNQGDGIGDTGTSNTFSGDVVSGNTASGIDLQGGGNMVSGCSVGTNAAGNAAIPNQTNGVLIGSTSNTISGDVVSGGIGIDILSSSAAYLVASTVYDNSNGGVISAGTLNIYNCTITGNKAATGAGIYNSGTLVIDDTTIAANTATSTGGGIDTASGTVTLENVIVAQNTGGDITGTVASASSYNLIGNGTNLAGITNGANHNLIGTATALINPLLGSLAFNGGTTETMAPSLASPAIGAGIGLSSISTDQCGVARPTSGAVDIGSVQHRGPTISSLSASASSVSAGTTVTLTANGVADADGNVKIVSFFRETNGHPGLNSGDTLIATTTGSGGSYTASVSTANLAPGTYTFYAQATDATDLSSNAVSTTVTVKQTGSITGTVFNDNNGDGGKDSNDAGLSGWRVYLDTNKDGVFETSEKSVITASNGTWSFTNLPLGTYRVREVPQSGWRLTTPSSGYYDITLTSSAANVTAKLFGDTKSVAITGTVFADTNGNGKKDSTEKGVAGWTVYLDTNNDGKLDNGEKSVVTDANGNFSFTGLAAGTYVVRIVPKGSAKITDPASGNYLLNLTSGQLDSGILFGEH